MAKHNSETADHFSKALKRKIEEFKDTELLIKTQVIAGAEEMIRHIQASKDELLTSFEKRFHEYIEHIKTVQGSLKTISLDVDNVDPETIKDNQAVILLVEMNGCISTCKNLLSKDEKPTFIQNPNCAVGYFTNIPKGNNDNNDAETICKSGDVIDINNKPHKCSVSVEVQTDYNDNFVANEHEAKQEESSSDEIKEDYPITISFDNEKGLIDKIIPISDQDAWTVKITICKLSGENDMKNISPKYGLCFAVQTECYDSVTEKNEANQQVHSSDELQITIRFNENEADIESYSYKTDQNSLGDS
ncbi:unnamed protein product [Mytilus edulis]|uniref:Uncharacterized protein n=1 Tax=Mytilus edulis TaxID=6550 RepID=A0A8S3RC17_MYTED|nr:unnamed protein product [Mytilus edulis]